MPDRKDTGSCRRAISCDEARKLECSLYAPARLDVFQRYVWSALTILQFTPPLSELSALASEIAIGYREQYT